MAARLPQMVCLWSEQARQSPVQQRAATPLDGGGCGPDQRRLPPRLRRDQPPGGGAAHAGILDRRGGDGGGQSVVRAERGNGRAPHALRGDGGGRPGWRLHRAGRFRRTVGPPEEGANDGARPRPRGAAAPVGGRRATARRALRRAALTAVLERRRILLWAAGPLAVLVVVVLVALAIVDRMAARAICDRRAARASERRGSAMTGTAVHVDDVDLSLVGGTATVRGFTIANPS